MCGKLLIGAVILFVEHLVTRISVMSVAICCSFIMNADDFWFFLCHASHAARPLFRDSVSVSICAVENLLALASVWL